MKKDYEIKLTILGIPEEEEKLISRIYQNLIETLGTGLNYDLFINENTLVHAASASEDEGRVQYLSETGEWKEK